MILMIDNYDSFTYNLVQYLKILGREVEVLRNDRVTPEQVERMAPRGIVISPGPGKPDDAGVSMEVIRKFTGRVPILGVCLGHQAIARVFRGKVVKAKRLMHGKTSMIDHDGEGVFRGLPLPFEAMRYHSLAVKRDSLSADLVVSATADDGEIMGLRHHKHPTHGIQFHPESIMTRVGKRLLRNFIKIINEKHTGE